MSFLAGAAESTRETLGGATGVADELPTAPLATAEEAFTSGMPAAAAVSAVTVAGMAVLAAIVLGRISRVPGRPQRR